MTTLTVVDTFLELLKYRMWSNVYTHSEKADVLQADELANLVKSLLDVTRVLTKLRHMDYFDNFSCSQFCIMANHLS